MELNTNPSIMYKKLNTRQVTEQASCTLQSLALFLKKNTSSSTRHATHANSCSQHKTAMTIVPHSYPLVISGVSKSRMLNPFAISK